MFPESGLSYHASFFLPQFLAGNSCNNLLVDLTASNLFPQQLILFTAARVNVFFYNNWIKK